jgi:pteridine reductase
MLNNQNNKLNPDNKQDNKVVLVTGGASRIGAAIVQYFHQQNYNIIIHYRSAKAENNANSLANSLNNIRLNSAKLIQAELEHMSDPVFMQSFAKNIIDCFGQLNTLVNNASSFFPTRLGEISLSDWRDLMISNAGGPFFLAQGLLPYLKPSYGSIVNISDIHAKRPLKDYPVYSMAKAANDMLTKALARELGPDIRVNAVAPGPVLWPTDNKQNILSDDIKNKIIARTVLKKLGSPIDIAKAVFFLAESDYITGQILAVDGGSSLKL